MSTHSVNYILRVDGSQEGFDGSITKARKAIGANVLDGFSLRDGRYVWVDDMAFDKGLPVNEKATVLYHSICKPGTTRQIRGDVAIIAKQRF